MSDDLIAKLKGHIQLEGDMDESMLPFYVEAATNYVNKSTGSDEPYLIVMIAALMFEYRVSEDGLKKALKAVEPLLILEVLAGGKTSDK
ncbi:head-tail connector protein [Brochothrix campestris]|uniref:Phage protein n=1 Tax=Brochothrix campestris FSL F6-1037 TaxID=1265861 RepID=W7CQQ2_9LIST|nr:head-tail connector protein [Brochothrix campestris]EUJ41974.1 Phage protein [Brochothrix campestris FSL F6-1037]